MELLFRTIILFATYQRYLNRSLIECNIVSPLNRSKCEKKTKTEIRLTTMT